MLEKAYIYNLLNEKKYLEIAKYFESEYKKIIIDFLIKKNIKFDEEQSINTLMLILRSNFKQYSNLVNLISDCINDEDLLIVDSLNKMIDIYDIVKKNLV